MNHALRRGVDALYAQPAVLLLLTALFWGGNAVAGQLAKGEITPLQLVLLRWVMVTAFMWPLYGAQVRAHWATARPKLARIVLTAVLGFTGFNTLFYMASLETTAVNIGILQGSIPVFVLLGAFLAHGTRVGLLQMTGVAVTLTGVVLIATQGAPGQVLSMQFNPGDLLMLLACACYSAYALLLVGRPEIPGAVFFTLMAPIATLTAIPFAAWEATQPGYGWPTLDGWLVTLFIAIFPSCLAQLFFLRGVDLIGPGRAGLYANLVPVFAAILAVLLLGEVFALYHGLALALVLGGIAISQRRAGG